MNGVSFEPGRVGQAFKFDGLNDYIEAPHAADIFFEDSDAFTLELWFQRVFPRYSGHF